MRNLIFNIFNFIYLILEKYFNLHLTRANFYSPIPNSKEIDDSVYTKVFSLKGININKNSQLELIKEFHLKYFHEFKPNQNTGLSLLDSFILYSFVRSKKPKKIVEIGYGATSDIISRALRKNINNLDTQFYSIDPFIKNINQIENNNIKIIQKKVQDIPIDFFIDIDFLFIDSSHVSKIGSDVNYEILEIIPTLNNNTIIHWHDIHFPMNYPKECIENKTRNMFWNESYLAHSFLLFNDHFKIVYSGKYLQLNCFNFLKEKFPYLSKQHSLTSFYIQKIK